jgi:uncharacterized membrane protein
MPLIIISFVFISSFIISPLLAEKDTIHFDEAGTVGEEDHAETIDQIENDIAKIVYRFGDRFCHQKHSRSWELNSNQMPVCARDVGLFLGIFLGCIFGSSFRKGIPLLVLLVLIAPMAVDGGLQAVSDYESFNLLRLITGILGGIGVGAYVNGSLVNVVRLLLIKRAP